MQNFFPLQQRNTRKRQLAKNVVVVLFVLLNVRSWADGIHAMFSCTTVADDAG
jgi:hypothetical protein